MYDIKQFFVNTISPYSPQPCLTIVRTPKSFHYCLSSFLEIGSWSGTSWKMSELGPKSPRTSGSEGCVLARQFWFLVFLLGVIRRAEGNSPNIAPSWRLQCTEDTSGFMQKVIEGRSWCFTEKSTLALQYHHSDLHKVSPLDPLEMKANWIWRIRRKQLGGKPSICLQQTGKASRRCTEVWAQIDISKKVLSHRKFSHVFCNAKKSTFVSRHPRMTRILEWSKGHGCQETSCTFPVFRRSLVFDIVALSQQRIPSQTWQILKCGEMTKLTPYLFF